MKVRVEQGDIARYGADVLVVNLFEGVTAPGGGTGAVDAALGGAISQVIAAGDLRGKSGELVTLHTFGKIPAPRVLVAGLGSRDGFDIDAVRNLAANVARALRRPGIRRAATLAHGAGIGGLDPEACAQAIAEGAILGSYRFLKHKSASDEERAELEELVIVEHDGAKVPAMQRAAERGSILAEATNIARDWANEPSNHLTPAMMAERAEALAREAGLEFEVLERADMERKGMGSLLSVAKGSAEPPKLIRLGWRGRGGDGWDLALVGKGITFDTGGISIKPAANMEAMKADMTGAASVIAAAWALARLGAKVNVLAIAPCTENMPSGSATKPGDVVTAMNGRTIEVINTDAEGRLVLADAICWANELGAKRIVDVATLTGAVTTALGDVCYALMTNDDALCRQVEAAAAAAGEKTWRLPMWKEYDEYIKSDVADCRNVGAGNRGAGTIVGAKFLEPFAGKTPWVHMDIAGVDNMSSDRGWVTKGASGYSVRAMINLGLALGER
ncbi:leucyl aminopeptidase [Tepidiforma flava]|uniref:Probable cytosol aminopeptidase n=1 Tax=Tepidiforma flava TaxID=3004094 RepID=A0ABY7M8G7_9CHLR|nr:leucyl aminopeptidase [Tepidiforma flava]WBL36826.1 leucyl aminopeptidase [Tepidiforma flava]